MEHIIRTIHPFKHILITHEVAPDDRYGRVIDIPCKLLPVPGAVSRKDPYIESVFSSVKFLESGPAHVSCGSGQKYCLLHTLYRNQFSGFCGLSPFHSSK